MGKNDRFHCISAYLARFRHLFARFSLIFNGNSRKTAKTANFGPSSRATAMAAVLALLFLEGCPIHGAMVRVTCRHGDFVMEHCFVHARGMRK